MATMPGMTVSDHTKIMEFVIANASTVGFFEPQTDAPRLLLNAATLTADTNMKQLLGRAVVETADLLSEVVQSDPVKLEWEEVRLILAKILLVEGDKRNLLAITKQLATKQKKGSIRTGLEIAVDILEDGFATIYEPEFWVVHQAVWPQDVFVSQLRNTLRNVGETVVNTAVSDVAGAVVGAVRGAITGGQAGAVRGGVAGAVAGSVKGGAKPAS